jgi:protocatechuate 3,4-dioxygenase beta subunit
MKSERRKFIKTALIGSAMLVVGRTALANICSLSPEQTTGPFIPDDFPFRAPNEGFPYIVTQDSNLDLTQIVGQSGRASGQAIYLLGQIVDENCQPVASANIYLWQADNQGHYNHSEDPNINTQPVPQELLDANFQYRGVVSTDANGRFMFKTIKPKYYPLDPDQPDFKRTAHLHIGIMKEGYEPLFTQTYFEGDVLEDILEIRRLNKLDILLGEWVGSGRNRRPTGKINPLYLPLIVNYQKQAEFNAPVGNIRLSIRKRN